MMRPSLLAEHELRDYQLELENKAEGRTEGLTKVRCIEEIRMLRALCVSEAIGGSPNGKQTNL